MKNAQALEIALSVDSFRKALPFYERLGLRPLGHYEETPFPSRLMTDGRITYGIHETPFHSPTLKFFTPDTTAARDGLEEKGISCRTDSGDFVELTDPNNVRILLCPLTIQYSLFPHGTSSSNFGMFGEFSIATENFRSSREFWEKLGFTCITGFTNPYPWGLFSDGLIHIGIHETHEFMETGITYFANDQPARIEQLRSDGYTFEVELNGPDKTVLHVVVKAPGGQDFFLFQADETELKKFL